MDQQRIDWLKREIGREEALMAFLSHPAFLILEKQAEDEIKEFQERLYNGGKPSAGDLDHLNVNVCRVEIAVRKNFLDLFRNSQMRLTDHMKNLDEEKKNVNGGSTNA